MRITSFYFGKYETFIKDDSGMLRINGHLASSIRLASVSGLGVDQAERIANRFRGFSHEHR